MVDRNGAVRLANELARALLGELKTLVLNPARESTRSLRRADGSFFSARVRTNRITLEGEPLTLAVVTDDLDDERLRQAIRLVGLVGFFDHDLVRNELHVSREHRELAGFVPDEEVSVEGFMARVHPDDREQLLAAIADVQASDGDGVLQRDIRMVRPDGTVRWVSARSVTLFEGTGAERRPVRLVGASIDITRRREEELAMRTWHQAVASSSSGLAISDLDGRLT
ncbi:MAG: PAS domain-containing protein [Myxococcota bacterium]